MQPAIRDYYHLEEIWGDKPVKMKLGPASRRRLVKARRRPGRPRRPAKTASRAAPARRAAQSRPSRAGAKTPRRARRAKRAATRRRRRPKAAACRAGAGPARHVTRTVGVKRTPRKTAPGEEGPGDEPAARRPRSMKLLLVAVGQRQPAWAEAAYDDFAKRFPPELRLELKAVKAEPRAPRKTAAQLMAAEAQRIEAALPQRRAPRRARRARRSA